MILGIFHLETAFYCNTRNYRVMVKDSGLRGVSNLLVVMVSTHFGVDWMVR
jgi:hypothetical protein